MPAGDTQNDPITEPPAKMAELAGKWCRCGGCGRVAQCTPEMDFHRVPGQGLRCSPCVGMG